MDIMIDTIDPEPIKSSAIEDKLQEMGNLINNQLSTFLLNLENTSWSWPGCNMTFIQTIQNFEFQVRKLIDKDLTPFQNMIIENELKHWKKRQLFEKIPDNKILKNLQNVVNEFYTLIYDINDILIKFLRFLDKSINAYKDQMKTDNEHDWIGFSINTVINIKNISTHLLNKLYIIYTKLVKSSFIVSKQPGRKPKQLNLLKPEVMCLLNNPLVYFSEINVTFTIVNRGQAIQMQAQYEQFPTIQKSEVQLLNSGTITNNTITMKRNEEMFLVADFEDNKSKLLKVIRSKIKGSKVTDEIFCIYFQIEFTIGEIPYRILIPSNPFVVILSENQAGAAWGTITFYNHFFDLSNSGQVVIETPDWIHWEDLKKILNQKFGKLGHELTQDNLAHIRDIIGTHNVEDPNKILTSQLCEKKFKLKKSFFGMTNNDKKQQFQRESFWDWIHSIIKLIKGFLLSNWTSGSIFGFISQINIDQVLSTRNNTFIIQFSDTTVGDMIINYVSKDGMRVSRAFPAAEFLKIQSLAVYLRNCPDWSIFSLEGEQVPIKNAFPIVPEYFTAGQDLYIELLFNFLSF